MNPNQVQLPTKPRRAASIVVACVIALVVAYVALVLAYLGTFPATPPAAPAPPAGGLAVEIVALGLDPNIDQLSAEAVVEADPSLLNGHGELNRAIELKVSPALGNASVTLPASSPVGTQTLKMPVYGFVEQWPFDRYTIDGMTASACLDACGVGETAIPVTLTASSVLPGWQVHQSTLASNSISLTFDRSASVVLFGLVIVGVLVLGATLAVTVAVLTRRRKLQPQPAFFGWYAALLFAIVPLRTFLPGSPPIGSMIDFVVVLWVIVAITISLTSYIMSWFRVSPKIVSAAEDSEKS